ncbi:hypothetical protein HA466_0322660 [Hirschfeldia incana]|nr:hypothetical protein HA466_0322660 [Hirschfeldia incana]
MACFELQSSSVRRYQIFNSSAAKVVSSSAPCSGSSSGSTSAKLEPSYEARCRCQGRSRSLKRSRESLTTSSNGGFYCFCTSKNSFSTVAKVKCCSTG